MDKTWLCSSVLLIYIMQMQHVFAADCNITSVTSPSGSTLNVTWTNYTDASVYLLDLRDGNTTNVAPVVVMQSVPNTQALVQGLKPGHIYTVTLNVFHFYTIVCSNNQIALTVPDVTQFTLVKAISSTSLRLEWASVMGAVSYIFFVEESMSPPRKGLMVNQTVTTTSGQVGGLTPATLYNCYVYTSNSAGLGAKSSVKTIMTLVQPPTTVTLVSTGKSTARVTWSPVGKVLLYQVTITASNKPNIPTIVKNSSATFMDISDLAPCTTYTVGVSSLNTFMVPGDQTVATINTTGIIPVTSVSASYVCSTGTVTVSWDSVLAPSYRATVVDGTGASRNCTSSSTTCDITDLACGEVYQVYVTAISSPCEITSNATDSFQTVPCAPANTQAEHECSSNAVLFSWQPTNNTFYYVASAVDNNGQVTQCVTLDYSCYFVDVSCGHSYNYTVYSVSGDCNSQVSQPVPVWTAPCLPNNIITTTDCNSANLITSWDPAAGAALYSVEALGNSGRNYYCNSTSTSCVLSGVGCGEFLSVWLVASNQNCSTNQVLGYGAQSVPCSPTGISVSSQCIQDSTIVNWTMGIGAIFYIAVAEDPNGNSHTCNSLATNCFVRGLRCGQNYTASVISTNLLCNSTSTQVGFTTAPCPPSGVQATRDCDANRALIAWKDEQLPGHYTATIEDQSNARLSCTSDAVNNCSITSPPCGKTFNVTVTYDDGRCLSYSAPVSMDSVPCGPVDVRASVSCTTGELTVAWNNSVPASNYTTVISRQTGQPLRCDSVDTQCTTGGLSCGSSYSVAVFSMAGTCSSLPSSLVTVQSLPCPPTGITAVHTCAPDPVPVSWVASDSARSYTAVAVTSAGVRSQCVTNTTSCAFPGLSCGDVYSITVAGANDVCTGQPSDNITLVTEPCAPTNVSSQLSCSAGIAQVSWAPSVNALSYAVRATSNGQVLTCTGSGTNCTLADLVCGQAYDIQVSATDGTCVSNYSAPFRQDKVPCSPQNVSTALACDTNILTVSWTPPAEALNYSVSAVLLGGNTSSVGCITSGASCDLAGLQCGQTYNVSVRASSGSCSGPCSSAQTVRTAPCSPPSLTAVVDCGTDALLASWSASLGAASYSAMVTGPGGFSKSCSSSALSCSVSGLQCASQYDVTVAAQYGACTSSPSQTRVTTGPCEPTNVTSALVCGSDTATVSWEAAAGAVSYTAVAQDSSSHLYTSCSSNTTSCGLERLQCGKVYNLTVLAGNAACNSTGSNTAVLVTAPCPPPILNSTLICGTNYSSVSWTPVANAIDYTVTATTTSSQQISCNSATAECDLADLMCSETYATTVIARGRQCDSAPSSSINITTVPCSPDFINAQYSCDTNTAAFSWTDPAGSFGFRAQIAGNGYKDSYQTTSTSCVFYNLPCGLNFNASVEVQGPQCHSLPSVSKTLETVPCAPTNVSASLVCLNNSALVTWVGTPPAVTYNVAATTQDGLTSYCYTSTTSCEVAHIQCGQTYNITVTPHSQSCTGNPSSVYSLSAGLCAPSDVSISPTCGDNTVSWSTVTGAQMYRATATSVDGNAQTWSSNTSNSCGFTGLLCGQTYSVAVATLDRGCWSEPSPAVNLTTAPCPPTDLSGQFSCDGNVLTVTWSPSPVPGATYMLQTETVGGAAPTEYLTMNTSYTLTNTLCGERYTFRVAAQDKNCSGNYSSPIEISTEPCQPANVSAVAPCQNDSVLITWNQTSNAVSYVVTVTGNLGYTRVYNTSQNLLSATLPCGQDYNATLRAQGSKCYSLPSSAAAFSTTPCIPGNVTTNVQCRLNTSSVSWEPSNGARTYVAVATGQDGHAHSCATNSTSCSWNDLHCGEEYSVVVTADSGSCSSLPSSTSVIHMMPCVPMNVSVLMDCASSTANVSWSPSRGAVQYSVTAHSSYSNVSCQSSGLSCTLHNLTCGSGYAAQVVAVGGTCSSVPSEAVTFNSSPCPPQNVSAHVSCQSDDMMVSWGAVRDADRFLVSLLPPIGAVSGTCNTTNTSCSINNVTCGNSFTVQVTSVKGDCNSQQSQAQGVLSAPCQPQGVTGSFDCLTKSALISWAAADGAHSYTVTSAGGAGYAANCTTASGTACEVKGLACGLYYSFSVTAANTQCVGPPSSSIQVETEPCVPTSLSVSYNQSVAQVSWNQADGATSYFVQAESQQGPTVPCISNGTWCFLGDLQCSRMYNITVTAQNPSCNSTAVSEPYVFVPEPCPPTHVQASVVCDQLTSTVSWQQSSLAVGYVAYYNDRNGHYASCSGSSADTSCSASGLMCGAVYSVWVQALGQRYNSSDSAVVVLTSAPCRPSDVSVEVDCESDGAAAVSWTSAYGTANFSLSADVGGSVRTLCTTQQSSCNVTGLSCGQTYNVSVTASNEQCVAAAVGTSLTTRPCPPQHVAADLLCDTQTVVLSWDQASDVDLYRASATTASGGGAQTCNSTNATCQFTGLACGETYSFTVVAHSRGCWSRASNPVSIPTEPCQPAIVSAEAPCQNDSVLITWNQTSNAVSYVVTVTGNLGYGSVYNTSQNLLSATLPCGQDYNATLRAQGSKCYSLPSSAAAFSTTPCIPGNVTTNVQCRLNTSSVSWEPSNGARTYVAVATGQDGHAHSCATNSTSCSWNDLHCGEEYSVVVTADSGSCSSLPSSTSVIHMMPCVPMNVSVLMDCASSTANVSWSPSRGAVQYSVTAHSSYSDVSCQSSGLSCTLHNLTCGSGYAAQVVAVGGTCSSVPSEAVTFNSSPCPPQNVSAHVSCQSDDMMVSWGAVRDADRFLVSLLPPIGAVSGTCNTTNTSCSINNVTCGNSFTVQVTSVKGDCNSQSQAQGVLSAPCQPQGVTGSFDCLTKSALISWAAADGADSYTVTSAGGAGYAANCTTASGTACEVKGLACGLYYSFSVTAANTQCVGPPSSSIQVETEPCVPTSLSVSYNQSVAQVSWNQADGATSYFVQAESQQGPTVPCISNGTWCFLGDLQCSRMYNITVTAQNPSCNSTAMSEPYVFVPEPCPPTHVQASVVCDQLTSTVSWQQSSLAVGYVAYYNDRNGHYASCSGSSADTSCSASGLMCGAVYSVWVQALGQRYNSSDSAVVVLTSAPCRPSDVSVEVDCESDGAAAVSWTSAYGTANFSLSADVGGSGRTLCTTQQSSCNVTGLSCGQTYNVSVTASNEQCVAAAVGTSLTTRPCPPQHVAADLLCDTQTVILSWDQAPDVDLYRASATTASGGGAQTCNSTNATCQFTGLACGETYSFTVVAHSRGCWSRASNPVSIPTEPCQPAIVSAEAPCQNDSVLITWNQTSNTVSYVVTVTGNLGYARVYNTSQNLLSATLPCGQDYNATLRAQGSKCYSLPSSAAAFSTTPCIPGNVTTNVQCRLNTSSVSWEPSNGARTYVAVATGQDGHAHSCATNSTSCSWNDLHCGEEYSVVVTADSGSCSSLPSSTSVIHMMPCVPMNVSVLMDCASSTANVSWSPSRGAVQYSVTAHSSYSNVSCQSSGLSCTLHNLTCGSGYAAQVVAVGGTCSSVPSEAVTFNSSLCPPDQLSVTMNCKNVSALLSWTPSENALEYYGCAQTGTGDKFYCHSTKPSCVFMGLVCGTVYNFTVLASDGKCNSSFSNPVQTGAENCVPDAVAVQVLPMQAMIQVLHFNWTQSSCADTEYLLVLTGSLLGDSQALVDISSYWTNSTYFEVPLPCGTSYAATVESRNIAGTSDPSASLNSTTAPCPPSGAVYTISSAQVVWDASVFATEYTVYDASVSPRAKMCRSTVLSCSLSCSTCTNLVITASNSAGESEAVNVATSGRRRRDLSD